MSSESEGTRKLRRHFADAPGIRDPGIDCPTPEQIWAGILGKLPPQELAKIIDHTIVCSQCAEAWRLARELSIGPDEREMEGNSSQAQQLPRSRWLSSWRISLAAAAMLALLLLLPQLWDRDGDGQKGVQRGPLPPVTSLVSEAEGLPRGSFLLRWTPGPEGSVYSVIVTSQQLDLLVRRENLTEPQFRVPPAALESLEAGSQVYWRVEVVGRDGVRFQSPTFIAQLGE